MSDTIYNQPCHPMDCKKCPKMVETRKRIVSPILPASAEILFVFEYPNEAEEVNGVIGTGGSGNIFNNVLRILRVDKSDPRFAYTYITRCRPTVIRKGKDGKEKVLSRKILPKEITNCYEHFEEDLKQLPNLKVIVTFGLEVNKQVTTSLSIRTEDLRNFTIFQPKYNILVVPTFHPIQVMWSRSSSDRAAMQSRIATDIQKAISITQYPRVTQTKVNYKVARTLEQVKWAFNKAAEHKYVAFDYETSSLDYLDSELLCISLTWQEHTGVTIPLLGQFCKPYWSDEEYIQVKQLMKEFLENKNIVKLAQNGKFDVQQAKAAGIETANFHYDTMNMHYLINENLPHDLKTLAWLFTDVGGYEDELDEIRSKYAAEYDIPKKKASYDIIPPEILWKYAATDTDVTYRLFKLFLPILQAEQTEELYDTLYGPFTNLLAEIEFQGISVDKSYLNKLAKEYKERIAGYQKSIMEDPVVQQIIAEKREMYQAERRAKWKKSKHIRARTPDIEEYANYKIEELTFNQGSSKDLELLFIDKLKLTTLKTEKGGNSFNKDAMEILKKKAKVAEYISKMSHDQDMLTKFILGIKDNIRKDGKLHTSFNTHVAGTGRLSSSNPNMQNIPNIANNPDDALLLRNIFKADSPEDIIVDYDYGQAEFRVWGQMSQDPVLFEDLQKGIDIHKYIGSLGFNVPEDKVTKNQRGQAKNVVFGKMYGRGNKSVALQLGIPISQADHIENIFFGRYKRSKEWLEETAAKAKTDKFVRNLFGQIRHLSGYIDSVDFETRSKAERQAVNSPIQGGASQMGCYAALKIAKRFKEENIRGRILLFIHDAIVFNIKRADLIRAVTIIEECMLNPHPSITIPLTIEGKLGPKWGTTIDITEENKVELLQQQSQVPTA